MFPIFVLGAVTGALIGLQHAAAAEEAREDARRARKLERLERRAAAEARWRRSALEADQRAELERTRRIDREARRVVTLLAEEDLAHARRAGLPDHLQELIEERAGLGPG